MDLRPDSYELTVKLLAEPEMKYRLEGKVWADDLQGRDGLVRLWGGSTRGAWLPMKPIGINTMALEFDAGGQTDVSAEATSLFPLANCAWLSEPADGLVDGRQGDTPVRQYRRTYVPLPNRT